MTKVLNPDDPYTPYEFVTADQIVQHFGIDAVTDLPFAEQARYNQYAAQANKQTEATIYKYVDQLPLDSTDESRTYAEGMAFWYALWLKQSDDGANNVTALKDLWMGFKQDLISVFQSQPKLVTTRRMVSNGYPDSAPPYSQSYGLSDIL